MTMKSCTLETFCDFRRRYVLNFRRKKTVGLIFFSNLNDPKMRMKRGNESSEDP